MKRIVLTFLALTLVLSCLLSFAGCELFETETETQAESLAEGEKIEAVGLWKNATYLSNTTVGDGAKSVTFTVEAEGKMITVTLKTDKETLGEAMFEHDLINDASFFNVLNGMEASWEKDQAYWAFYEGETMMPYGVNDQKITGGESFRFVYTK
jgi:hypothetical protein